VLVGVAVGTTVSLGVGVLVGMGLAVPVLDGDGVLATRVLVRLWVNVAEALELGLAVADNVTLGDGVSDQFGVAVEVKVLVKPPKVSICVGVRLKTGFLGSWGLLRPCGASNQNI